MATINSCDLCGKPAVAVIEAKSDKTTPIKLDVCETHLAAFKKVMREFTGQELAEEDADKNGFSEAWITS